jgi:hypothetical protein
MPMRVFQVPLQGDDGGRQLVEHNTRLRVASEEATRGCLMLRALHKFVGIWPQHLFFLGAIEAYSAIFIMCVGLAHIKVKNVNVKRP